MPQPDLRSPDTKLILDLEGLEKPQLKKTSFAHSRLHDANGKRFGKPWVAVSTSFRWTKGPQALTLLIVKTVKQALDNSETGKPYSFTDEAENTLYETFRKRKEIGDKAAWAIAIFGYDETGLPFVVGSESASGVLRVFETGNLRGAEIRPETLRVQDILIRWDNLDITRKKNRLESLLDAMKKAYFPGEPATHESTARKIDWAAGTEETNRKMTGLVTINAEALIRFMADLKLTEAALATKADVGEGTVKRARDGGEIERDHLNKLAEALGIDPAQLLPKAQPLAIATAIVNSPDRPHVEIILDGPPEKLEAVIRENYAGRIVADLNGWLLTGGTLVVKIKARSIHIILEMDKNDAKRLVKAWERRQLDYLNIVGVRILPPSRWWSDYLGAIFGGIGIISCLLGFVVEPIRAYAAIAALFSACVGLLFLGRSIYVRLQR